MRPARNSDLDGSAPDTSSTILLIIDVINDFDFIGGSALYKKALPIAKNIAALKAKCKIKKIPVIYANDNFGRWKSDLNRLVDHGLNSRGKTIVELLQPEHEDYFVLKPKQSAFYASTLETLLHYLGAKRLLLVGWTTDICILFTANDAYMRDYEIIIPRDCVAAIKNDSHQRAMKHLRTVLKAKIVSSKTVKLARK